MSTPNGPLQEFFSQFNFHGYTYDPHTPALEEFKFLCQARQWGRRKIREHETALLLAVEREQDLRRSLAGLNMPLQEFFSQFNFYGYTYDPHTPVLEEFGFLCQAWQWGPSMIREQEMAFLIAVERERDLRGSLVGPNVFDFFRKYEFQRFTYNLDAPIQSEFQRLVKLRGWGEANLSKVAQQFNRAVVLDATEQSVLGTQEAGLLAHWLIEQECHGYRYLGGLPEIEFKKLVRVKRWKWNQVRREAGMDTRNEAWKESEEFNQLHTEFYEVVEEAFNLLLDSFCQIARFEPWQVLVGLYGPGLYGPEQGIIGLYGQELESMGKEAAKIILKSVFVNIFDFLDAFQEILRDPPTTDRWMLLQLLRPLAIELQFPNNSLLGVYSALTNRVFPLEIAEKDGTLVLLLHRIRVFWKGFRGLMKDFEEEAGYELQEAEAEGRVGIRRLLLSREWACFHSLRARQQAVPF
ncbi:hypothetical protein B9Z19DRAFT_1074171 [Tuber borchii]|uniref:Uncharacterized protein n=1 Tax=Tuber borchii TaxID=42251 RepID=A0A2T7A4U5_TUBBO|nr:hypothetical protein B9Z19DRAFT_1074171 [Tuber borchii]